MSRNRMSFEKAERMREPYSTTSQPLGVPTAMFAERHYTVAEVAVMWNLSSDAIRKLFQNEPGVLVLGHGETRHQRRYTTLRIPESVLQRVHRRMSKV